MYVWHWFWELEENSVQASTLMCSKWSGTKRTDLLTEGLGPSINERLRMSPNLPELCLLRDIPEPTLSLKQS